MRNTLFLVIACFGLFSSTFALAENDLKNQIRGISVAEQQDATIAQFVKVASTATDEDSLLLFIWPATLQAFGADGWKNYLRTKIIPYFAGAGTLDSYQGLAQMTMEQDGGTPAIVHFGYARGTDGKRKPFEMVMVTTAKGIFIANVMVGTCRKGNHPVCE